MDDQRPEDAAKLAAFPRQSAMPCVCVADGRQQMRTFLAETLEDLGCVTCECVHVAGLNAELGTRPPDLVVIGSSAGGIEACEMVELRAAKEFGGKVLVLGPRASPMVAAIQELGAKLGLAMLPLLPTPFSQGDLRSSIAALLPIESPAKHSVDTAEALHAGSLELWYPPKIDMRTLALSGAEALAPIRHRTLGVLPPEYVMPDDPHVGAVSELVIDRMINDWRYFTAQHGHIEIAVNLPITLFRDPELIEHLYRRIPDHPAFEGLIVQVNAADVVRNLGLVKKVASYFGTARSPSRSAISERNGRRLRGLAIFPSSSSRSLDNSSPVARAISANGQPAGESLISPMPWAHAPSPMRCRTGPTFSPRVSWALVWRRARCSHSPRRERTSRAACWGAVPHRRWRDYRVGRSKDDISVNGQREGRTDGEGASTNLRSSSSDRVDGKLIAFLLFGTHHSRNYLCKADPWSPAELPCRLRWVAPRVANVSGTSERGIAFDVVWPSQSNFGKRGRHKFIQPVGCTRSNNKILGPIMLQHHPHRFYVVRRPAPVAMNRNVAEL